MLSPEVWNFKPPQHHFSVERRNCGEKDIPSVVKTHYFNHSVSVVLPNTIRVPDSLRSCVSEDSDYYRVNALNVYDLLNKEFIEAFVVKGELNLLAIENRIDLDSSISITPSGYLILSLIQEDFQKLGLEGKASLFDRKAHTRYVVTIDLKKEYFTPGKKNYEHTRAALEKRFNKKFDVIVAWDPPEEKVCPSSIAAWFHKHGYKVSLCRQTFFQRTQYSLQIPIISNGCDIEAFLEWLGIFCISGDLCNGNEDNFVNMYQCPSPFMQDFQIVWLVGI
ncbi:hypothetical protein KM043_017782 [Ampulex compressa]|nr:hypothetical protein KM043_017782 [Ampulex compressa]